MLNQQKNLPDLTISHPILYVPNTQATHTLYKKQRSEDTPKTSTSSFKENEFQQIYFGKDAKTSIYKKRSMQNPRAAQKKNASKNEPVESGKTSLSVTIDVDEPSLKLKSEYRFFIGY